MHPNISVPSWSLSEAKWAFFWCLSLLLTSLSIVSFPHNIHNWFAISAVLVTSCGAFYTGGHIIPDAVFVDYYLRFIIILASHMTWLLYSGTLNLSVPRRSGEKNRWTRGYKILFNPRGIGQDWELPHLWPSTHSTFQSQKGKASTTQNLTRDKDAGNQCKSSALLTPLGHALLNFTILCVYYEFISLPSSPFLHRPLLALSNFAPDYLILSTYHSLFAFLFILLSLDMPNEWPALFGPISAAYTVRGFWGKFWHRLIYRSFIGHAGVLMRAVGINQRSTIGRLLSNVLVFVLSGLMHGAVPWMLGTKCAWRAGMEYWMMQPIAFVLEGGVAWCWGRARRLKLDWASTDMLTAFEKAVGYAWVLGWLVWEAPRREGAVLRCYGVQQD
ncbi:membrane bound O-acyl transferase family-domain-containing protein [Phaeosphaeria sp. MPI-PUGE-AT-0046c]|nr:membrane bound O-acyl transferase family-domain-containing protein [Phaeosphaeria sp. MPI-PUGE-AT-0046c]